MTTTSKRSPGSGSSTPSRTSPRSTAKAPARPARRPAHPRAVKPKPEAHVAAATKAREGGAAARYDFVFAVGRRKTAIARVRVFPRGAGTVAINNQELAQYFPTPDQQFTVLQPLELVGLTGKVDVRVKTHGGGKYGQAVAVRHGLARCLLKIDENYRKQLRPAGFLTRDSRIKERKKPGLKRARRAPQFSKR